MLTASEFAEKHARNLVNSQNDIVAGINKVTVSPTKLAAAKQEKMIQNLTASVRDGSWARGLNKVSLDDWKKKAIEVGVGRIPAGIAAAKDKVEKFASEFLPFVEKVAESVRAMPDMNLQDSIARMTKQVTETAKFTMK